MKKFGADIGVARRKRFLTVTMLSERVGIAESTYLRAERGDPTVAFGVYAMILFVLGFGDAFADLIDVRKDDQGLLFDAERLPKRIRAKKRPTSS
ncbi:MAG TPA: hypothetical protein VGM88_31980 [Kofleriaceae bacterium]